jgi:hypothetical protein
LPERRRKLELVAESIADTGKLTHVWIELDTVPMPHRKLPLGESAGRAALRRIPGPDFVRIEEVQLALELPAGKVAQVANEIPVDVVGVVLVLDERPVGKTSRMPACQSWSTRISRLSTSRLRQATSQFG